MNEHVLAVLETLVDGRIAGGNGVPEDELWAEVAAHLPAVDRDAVRAELEASGLVELRDGLLTVPKDASRGVRDALASFGAARRVDWATETTTQGEVLAHFAEYCRDELDDLDVLDIDGDVEGSPTRLALRWRREESRIEARTGFLFCERLAALPTMLLGDLSDFGPGLLDAFVQDETLRARVALCDLGRLEKVNAVRASAFVYFEWFLRDEYGVKLVPAPSFTRGLIERGVISLGFG